MKFYWIKNTLAALLCAGILLSSCACEDHDKNATTTTTTTTNTGDSATPPPEGAFSFENYTEILTTFRAMLKHRLDGGKFDNYPRPEYADERSREIWINLLTIAYNLTPEKMCYANRDFDSDGVPELILLSEDYELSAIFALCDSKPVFLDMFFDNNHLGAIDKDGYVFKSGYSKGDNWYKSVRQIKNGKLELVVEYGCKDSTDSGGTLEYYQIPANGNRITVEKSEIDAIETMYRPTFSNLTQITFDAVPSIIPFFNLPEEPYSPLSQLYREVLRDNVLVRVSRGTFYDAYDELSTVFSQITAQSIKNACFTMVDMNGDGINELMLQAPNHETVAIYYEDGVFYAHSLFEVDWLYTDGKIAQHDVNGYWGKKLQFEGGTVQSEKVYEVIWGTDGNPDALYLDGEAVTEEEFDAYVASCSAEKVEWHEITSQNLQLYVAANDEKPKLDFSTYDALIDSYRMIATLAPICYEAAKDSYEPKSFEDYFDLPDGADEQKIFRAIFDSVTARYAYAVQYDYLDERATLGYAYKDINRDGVDELILLTEVYEVFAIFTQKDGCPILLTYDTLPRWSLWFDTDGYIRTQGSPAGSSTEYHFYTISDGTLTLVDGVEHSTRTDGSESYTYIFSAPETSLGFGSRTITEAEYNAVLAKYIPIPVNTSGAYLSVYMKAEIGLEEIPLFPIAVSPVSGDAWITNKNPNTPGTKTVTVERYGYDWFICFRNLNKNWIFYAAPLEVGEAQFAAECTFVSDKISGKLQMGNHCMWLTVEASEFAELPVGTYLFFQQYYYFGK